MKTKITISRINKTKSWFFKKKYKIDKTNKTKDFSELSILEMKTWILQTVSLKAKWSLRNTLKDYILQSAGKSRRHGKIFRDTYMDQKGYKQTY